MAHLINVVVDRDFSELDIDATDDLTDDGSDLSDCCSSLLERGPDLLVMYSTLIASIT
jgi:hypothetical protein